MRDHRCLLYCLLGILLGLGGCKDDRQNSPSPVGQTDNDGIPSLEIQKVSTLELGSVEVNPGSTEPVALSLPDKGLRITVANPAIFQTTESLTVSEVATHLPAPAACYNTLAVFDISADAQTRFDEALTVAFAMESLGLDDSADLTDLYVGWWNSAMQGWVAIPFEMDAGTKTITFATQHLTVFGWFMSKAGYERMQMGTFEMIWDAEIFKAPADKSDAEALAGKIIYTSNGDAAKLCPRESWATDKSIPAFVRDLGAFLNYSVKAYKGAGFKVPSGTVSVVVETLLTEGDSRNKALDIIHIGGYNSGAAQLKTSAAHELFHAVQNEYLWDVGGMMFLNWWCESTAEYASHLVWDREHPHKSVAPKYFSERLDATGHEHEYQCAHFIDEIVGSGTRTVRFKQFYALWMGVQTHHGATDATDVIYPISLYLTGNHGSLSGVFNDHVYRLGLMSDSPMIDGKGKASPDRPVADMVESWALLRADEKETEPLTMELMGGHRAKFWAVRVMGKGADEVRSIELELSGEITGYIEATVHVLPGGKRSDEARFPQGRFTTAQPKVTLALSPDDAAYVVVINHGSPTQSFTLDVREADVTLLDVLHQMTGVLFSFEDQLLGKKTFLCSNIVWNGTSFQGERNRSGKQGSKDVESYDRVSGQVSPDGKTLVSLSFTRHEDITGKTPRGPYKKEVIYDVALAGIPIDPWLLSQKLALDRDQVFYGLNGTIPEASFPKASIRIIDEDGTLDTPLQPKLEGGKVKVSFTRK